jgi:glycosyltransferase involved in cell wall biosynthesis
MAVRAHTLSGVFVLPSVDDPADYLAVFDILVFPSYREGFPNVPLEAAASGIPTVGFDVTGVVDAVAHGETGTLVPVHDIAALTAAILCYVDNAALRYQHGQRARERVIQQFSNERVWELWRDEYTRLSQRYGVPSAEPLPLA